jgi:transposase
MSRTRWSRDLHKERLWRQRLARWQRSGLTSHDFCRREHLSEPSFCGWKREIARRDREAIAAAAPPRKRRRPPFAKIGRTDFVPVTMIGTAAPLEVVVRSGQTVRVNVGFDAAHLRAVVAALEARPC